MYNMQFRYNSFFYATNVGSPFIQGGCINPVISPNGFPSGIRV